LQIPPGLCPAPAIRRYLHKAMRRYLHNAMIKPNGLQWLEGQEWRYMIADAIAIAIVVVVI
jgi:hypothetical protein